jgi:hypothetical protein
MQFSPELTFVPSRAPYEITSKKEGETLVTRLNKALYRNFLKTGTFVVAKLDPFHNVYQPDMTYCVELCPPLQFPCETSWFEKSNADCKLFKKGVDLIFKTCREHGLVPLAIQKRNGKEIHQPSGGCHLHFANELFNAGPNFYKNMEGFHKNLIADFTNRPYIRWLFAQWFDDKNSNVIFSENHVHAYEAEEIPITRDAAFEAAFEGRYVIEPRFMVTGKGVYNTFEFRFINMVRDYTELRAVTQAIHGWIKQIQSSHTKEIPVTLTLDNFKDFNDLRKAKKLCKDWIEEIGLTWDATYEILWNRNYRNRIVKGALL